MTDEKAVICAARAGDRAAFGALVNAYQRRAYAACYSMVGNREDALELAQESFVRAFRAMPHFDPAMPFYPWFYRILHNICLNHLRKRKRRGESSLDAMMGSGFDMPAQGDGPASAAALGDVQERIHRAMAKIPPEQAEILRLRHLLELSYAEIAQWLKIPMGTVMSRLHAARQRLRHELEKDSREEILTVAPCLPDKIAPFEGAANIPGGPGV